MIAWQMVCKGKSSEFIVSGLLPSPATPQRYEFTQHVLETQRRMGARSVWGGKIPLVPEKKKNGSFPLNFFLIFLGVASPAPTSPAVTGFEKIFFLFLHLPQNPKEIAISFHRTPQMQTRILLCALLMALATAQLAAPGSAPAQRPFDAMELYMGKGLAGRYGTNKNDMETLNEVAQLLRARETASPVPPIGEPQEDVSALDEKHGLLHTLHAALHVAENPTKTQSGILHFFPTQIC